MEDYQLQMTINSLLCVFGQTPKEEHIFLWKLRIFQMSHLEKSFYMEITLSTISVQWVLDYESTAREIFCWPVHWWWVLRKFWTPNVILTLLAQHTSDTTEEWIPMLVLGGKGRRWDANSKEEVTLVNSNSGL